MSAHNPTPCRINSCSDLIFIIGAPKENAMKKLCPALHGLRFSLSPWHSAHLSRTPTRNRAAPRLADALRKLFVCLQMDELTRIAEAAKNGGEFQERSGAAE
jgi:hypothetical protein